MQKESRDGRATSRDVAVAAVWLATEKNPPHPIVPDLRQRFGLTLSEAVAAVREATLIKARAS
ncbi:hypothetical protein HNQ95_002600 [Aminobacter ciceronei]|uniref:Uncharacterized protein n=1 Tax=Aminobacter ciceronei TaxID=150723 RepID=A0ABR6C6G3_9HYPH|nr:hypothetical protein [Aminobacter ciceronei]MBA9020599.1 hypothetical protein [Aminobacter ciceronei]